MNEAHSWLKNPCEGLKHEQLRGRKAAPAACGMAKISSRGRGALASAGKHQVLGGRAPRRLLTAHLGWLHLSPGSTALAVGVGLEDSKCEPRAPLCQPLPSVQAGCDIWGETFVIFVGKSLQCWGSTGLGFGSPSETGRRRKTQRAELQGKA